MKFLLLTVLSLAALVTSDQAAKCAEGSFGYKMGTKVELPPKFIPPLMTEYLVHVPYDPKCIPIGLVVKDCELGGDPASAYVQVTSPRDAKIVRFARHHGAIVHATVYCLGKMQ